MNRINKKTLSLTILLFLLQVLFQAVGSFRYEDFPAWLWSVCDALILVTPFLLGLLPGVICCLPNTVSEILWLILRGYKGAFLHGAAFLLTVLLAGLLEKPLKKTQGKRRFLFYPLAFEGSLILENTLYRLLRTVFLASKAAQLTAANLLATTLSVGNPLCLGILLLTLFCRLRKKDPAELS